MSAHKKEPVAKPGGVELDVVTFDEGGGLVGLDDDMLDDVAGGLTDASCDMGCSELPNRSC
jgi:hypothetical protein